MSKSSIDNRSKQLNPNNDAFYQSRGYADRGDYYGGGDAVAAGVKGYTGPMHMPSLTPLQAGVEEVTNGIARNMTGSKVSFSICDYLKYVFEQSVADGVCEGSRVRLTVSQNVTDIVQFEFVVAEARRWVARHRWAIRRCVNSVALTHDGLNWVEIFDRR